MVGRKQKPEGGTLFVNGVIFILLISLLGCSSDEQSAVQEPTTVQLLMPRIIISPRIESEEYSVTLTINGEVRALTRQGDIWSTSIQVSEGSNLNVAIDWMARSIPIATFQRDFGTVEESLNVSLNSADYTLIDSDGDEISNLDELDNETDPNNADDPGETVVEPPVVDPPVVDPPVVDPPVVDPPVVDPPVVVEPPVVNPPVENPSIEIQYVDSSYQVNESDGSVTIQIERLDTSDIAVVAAIESSDGTAMAGLDYVAVTSQSVMWGAGESGTRFIEVSILPDELTEGNEEFELELTVLSPSTDDASVMLGNSTATVTIIDNVPPPDVFEIGLVETTLSVDEGVDALQIELQRLDVLIDPIEVTIAIALTDLTATAEADYQALTPQTITWGANDSGTKSIEVSILEDTIVEGVEEFELALSVVSNNPADASVVLDDSVITVTILDNDFDDIRIGFADTTYGVSEGDGSVTIQVERFDMSPGSVDVVINSVNRTAIAGEDYTAVTALPLTWAVADPGIMSFDVMISDDDLNEPAETFDLMLTVAPRSPGEAMVIVEEAIATVTISASDPIINRPRVDLNLDPIINANAISGFYNFSSKNPDDFNETDTVYVDIKDNNQITVYEYAGDKFDNGDDCYFAPVENSLDVLGESLYGFPDIYPYTFGPTVEIQMVSGDTTPTSLLQMTRVDDGTQFSFERISNSGQFSPTICEF